MPTSAKTVKLTALAALAVSVLSVLINGAGIVFSFGVTYALALTLSVVGVVLAGDAARKANVPTKIPSSVIPALVLAFASCVAYAVSVLMHDEKFLASLTLWLIAALFLAVAVLAWRVKQELMRV